MNHRHGSKTALICFLLCIPLAFIAYFAVIYVTEKISVDQVVSVEVSSRSDSYTASDAETISFFVDMFLDAGKLEEPLREPDPSTAITVNCDRGDRIFKYTVYPDLSTSACMFADPDGQFHIISKEFALKLLSRKEAAHLYTQYFTPTLTVASGILEQTVIPASYGWNYRRADGTSAQYTDAAVSDPDSPGTFFIYADRANDLRFSSAPDDYTVTISDSEGKLTGFTSLSDFIFAKDTLLNVKVDAVWNNTADAKSYGTVSYSFAVIYDIPSVVTFSKDTVEIGGFFEINVTYLGERESVTFNTALDIGTPVFTENQGVKTAVIGVSDEATPGVYDIVYSVGDNKSTFALTVTGTPRTERDKITRLNITAANYDLRLGDEALGAFEDTVNDVYASLGSVTYALPADFVRPVSSADTAQTFGERVIFNLDNTADTRILYSVGESYNVIANSKVMAAADGKVVYTGESATLGKFLVIDHGSGVCTWYYGMSTVARGTGTEVKSGSILGFAGVSYYTDVPTVGFFVTAGRNFVNPFPSQASAE